MVNTSLNPEFVMGNFSRDVQTAMYNLLAEQEMSQGKAKDQKLVKKVLLNTIPSVGKFYKALRRVDLKDGTIKGNLLGISQKDLDNYKDFVESGAKADWFYVRPVEKQVQTMDNLVDMAKGTFTGNFKQRREAIFNFINGVLPIHSSKLFFKLCLFISSVNYILKYKLFSLEYYKKIKILY